jgi:molybdopterin synthase sulfur carrier subunit
MTRILFFGRVSDAAGCSELTMDLPPDVRTLSEMRAWLAARDEMLAPIIRSPSVRAAVDQAFCSDEATIVTGAKEIAFMSPLSGG